jgi:hypothetical protein
MILIGFELLCCVLPIDAQQIEAAFASLDAATQLVSDKDVEKPAGAVVSMLRMVNPLSFNTDASADSVADNDDIIVEQTIVRALLCEL